jgi:hypothetical protein
MATVIEECTAEKLRSVVRLFLWVKGLNAMNISEKYFLPMVESICRVKWFITGSRNVFEGVRKSSQMMPEQVALSRL